MFSLSLPRTLAGVLLLSGAATAHAATLLVTTTADAYDGVCNLHCSLRDAIAVANQAPSLDTIVLPPGTYMLTRPAALDADGLPVDDDDQQIGDLDVIGDLRIKGLDTTRTIIQGQFNDRLFEVRPDARLRLEKLSLQGGDTVHNGGAVKNLGQLRLHEVLVQNNRAVSPLPDGPLTPGEDFDHGQGGAIVNHGDLTITASRLQFNHAEANGLGFASGGRGGAIFNYGSVRISESNLYRNNIGGGDGGGGPAIYNLRGNVEVERSVISGHTGQEFSSAAVLNFEGEITLSNSTLTGNSTGALGNFHSTPASPAKATLTNVTVTANDTCDRWAVVSTGDLRIRNSIIAGNFDFCITQTPLNCATSGTYEAIGLLAGDEPSSCTADLFASFEDVFTKVLYHPINKHSNTVWTYDLRPGSAAIDAGIGDCIAQDQRGVARPKDGNGDGVALCDLGAYELQP